MTDYTPPPQTIVVGVAPRYMDRPVEIMVTEHLNESHTNATKIYLTHDEALSLFRELGDHLIRTEANDD